MSIYLIAPSGPSVFDSVGIKSIKEDERKLTLERLTSMYVDAFTCVGQLFPFLKGIMYDLPRFQSIKISKSQRVKV